MGLDYSFELFVPRDRFEHTLGCIVPLVRHKTERRMTFVLDAQRATVNLWDDYKKIDTYIVGEGRYGPHLCLSIYFDEDDAIAQHIHDSNVSLKWQEQQFGTPYQEWQLPRDEQGRVAIGCIYFDINPDLNSWAVRKFGTDFYDSDLIKFRFTAATTGMSLLFDASQSIRDTFTLLAMESQSRFALLDREEDAAILWWRDQIVNVPIPGKWISQEQMKRYIDGLDRCLPLSRGKRRKRKA